MNVLVVIKRTAYQQASCVVSASQYRHIFADVVCLNNCALSTVSGEKRCWGDFRLGPMGQAACEARHATEFRYVHLHSQ